MTAGVHYRVDILDPHTHLLHVTLRIDRPAARQRVSLPVWIPGSYLVREFSQHLQELTAERQGRAAALKQIDKNTWEAPVGSGALTLRYAVYAFDASVRTAYLDAARGFFNPTSVCLRVHGQEKAPHQLELVTPPHARDWQVATGLEAVKVKRNGFGLYQAADYDELADCPVEMGAFWSGSFKVRGVPHRLVVSSAGPWVDFSRLLRDTQAICETEIAFWHGSKEPVPFKRYVFMLNASQDGYGGLEHRNSTALICQQADLPRLPETGVDAASNAKPRASDGYTTLLGLISHEYFHTWNVKRLRPKEFARYDYDHENYTPLLWFFEGFTSYYDDLFLLRAGLIDANNYLLLLGKTINQVLQTPGRQVQSVAQASFDAWIKYYRVQENTPNATVSYYTKGALVALCLDLTLRAEGHTTLDAVMRELYRRCDGGPMSEADVAAVLKQLGKRSYATELAAWVHGTSDLPLQALLERHGLQWQQDLAPLAQRLGLRVTENGSLLLKNVLRGSVAEAAGLAAGDEWLAVELPAAPDEPASGWRVYKLDDVALYSRGQTALTALVARDGRLLRCTLDWPAASHTVRLLRPSKPATETTTESRWLQE